MATIDVSETVGQRIVQAARMAAAMHMHARQQLALESAPINPRQQRIEIGGAGPRLVTDDGLSDATGRAEGTPSLRAAASQTP